MDSKQMTDSKMNTCPDICENFRDDQRAVESGWILSDRPLIEEFVNRTKTFGRFDGMSADEILDLQKVTKEGKPNLAGFLVFSRFPQSEFPGLGVIAAVVEGKSIEDAVEQQPRFLDSRRIEGSIPEMLEESILFLCRNMKSRVVIDEAGQCAEQMKYPVIALREAILNALVHREYSPHPDGTPVEIRVFSDRIEITSSGGVYRGFPVSQPGKENPELRNSTLVRILETLNIMENRYCGIPTMKKAMKVRGLRTPEYIHNGRQFKVVFHKTPDQEESVEIRQYLQALRSLPEREIRVQTICFEALSRKEIAERLHLHYTYVTNILVKPLIEKGLLAEAGRQGRKVQLQTIPMIRKLVTQLRSKEVKKDNG